MAQPEILEIDAALRLRKPEPSQWAMALPWYQDPQVLRFSEGTDQPYDMEVVNRMYEYLQEIGELYFIEIKEGDQWLPIGDVTLADTTMPVTIGIPKYWGQGIGRKAIIRLLDRARDLGYKTIKLKKIYHYNQRSQRMFQAVGFKKIAEDETGILCQIDL